MEERLYTVRGRVQGVGFRWWTKNEARHLHLTGSVRNLRDGSVEVLARGTPEALAALRQRLEAGPPGASVTSIEEAPGSGARLDGFEIGRD